MRAPAFHGVGQVDSHVPIGQVVLARLLWHGQLDAQRLDQAIGHDGDPVLSSLGVSHDDLVVSEIHVFDAQPHAFRRACA